MGARRFWIVATKHREAAARWLTRADPAGLLYGAIVSAAVLVTVSAHADDNEHVVLSTTIFLAVYYMAHVYIDTLTTQFRGDSHGFFNRLAHAAADETGILKGGVPAIVVYAVAAALGGDVTDAAQFAAYFSVLLLVVVGYLGAHQAGLHGRAMLAEVAAAGAFGVLIVLGKAVLH